VPASVVASSPSITKFEDDAEVSEWVCHSWLLLSAAHCGLLTNKKPLAAASLAGSYFTWLPLALSRKFGLYLHSLRSVRHISL
jgi:hypothetical protein